MRTPEISRQSIPRARLLLWLDQDVPLSILHGPAGTGKSELLTLWLAGRPGQSVEHFSTPPSVRDLTQVLPDSTGSVEGEPSRLVVIIDSVDDDLRPEVERLMLGVLRADSTVRFIIAGRSTRMLEEQAQRNRVRVTTRFGEDLLATTADVASMVALRGQSTGEHRVHELADLTNGWWEPLRLILDESPQNAVDLGAAKRWIAHVAFDGLTSDDLSVLYRLSLLDRITSDTAPLAAATISPEAFDPAGIARFHDRGLLRAGSENNWVIVPVVRSVIEDQINDASVRERLKLHSVVAESAYASGPRRFAREILRHAQRGHAWHILERFWTTCGEIAMAEHPHETSAAFAAIPDHVVHQSSTLTVAATLSSASNANEGVLERLAHYSGHHVETRPAHQLMSTDAFVESTVIRILKLRQDGQFIDAYHLGDQAQHEVKARLDAGAEAPTSLNSALLLVQHAANRMLADNDGAAAAALARHALEFARASKLESLASDIIGYLDVLKAAHGWSPRTPTHVDAAVSSKPNSNFVGSGHEVARAMAAVDSLDREFSNVALDHAKMQAASLEIWPLAALAESRHALFFETPDILDDRYRHMVWSHPTARDEPGTGRMILDWSGVLADLRAGRLNEAERRIADSPDSSSWLSVLTARLHVSNRDHEAALDVIRSASGDDDNGNRERAQFLFMGAASSLELGNEHDAAVLFRRARSIADVHGLRSTYLAISRDHRTALLSLTDHALPPEIARRLDALPDAFPEREPRITLSAREAQVLHGISKGATHREIAHALYVSLATVRSHVRTLYAKLSVSDSATALGRATEQGLLLSDPANGHRSESTTAVRTLHAAEMSWERIRSLTGITQSGT